MKRKSRFLQSMGLFGFVFLYAPILSLGIIVAALQMSRSKRYAAQR